ncbi:hypothetical protein LJC59_05645, partial [Desulfovibrio sp. OttesenSCG-928-A18]|nr:hypothetical protein [Desulfovibrio sp. OttesenSCG-928-A18]
MPVLKSAKALALLLACLIVLQTGACATKMYGIMPRITDMSLARHYFGEPSSSTELGDGTVRHDWVLDRVMARAGYYETWCPRFYNRDRFPKCSEYEIWIPPSQERLNCRLSIVADQAGRVLSYDWSGNSCDELPL